MHDRVFDNDIGEIMSVLISKNIAVVTIGTDIIESQRAKEFSDKYSNSFYTIGVHPHDILEARFDEQDFIKLLSDKCVAIGECGLDYFYLKEDFEKLQKFEKIQEVHQNNTSGDNNNDLSFVANNNLPPKSCNSLSFAEFVKIEKERQKEIFIKQIQFAKKYNKKLMIHGRPSLKNDNDNKDGMDAYKDIINILKAENFVLGGNMHFFVGDIVIAKECIDLGFTFSFGGVITLTQDYHEVLKFIPLDYIHAETDSPYVMPKDSNNKRIGRKIGDKLYNTSENIDIIISKIAEIKDLDKDFVIQKLRDNFDKFIKIPL